MKVLLPILLLLLLTLSGCATMIRGETESVRFISEPGATITLDDDRTCTSPCEMTLERGKGVAVTAAKKGCKSKSAALTPKVEASTFMYSGVFDYQGNGAYTLTPNPLVLPLDCKRN